MSFVFLDFHKLSSLCFWGFSMVKSINVHTVELTVEIYAALKSVLHIRPVILHG